MTPSPRNIRISFRFLAIALGFLQAWAYRFRIEPDGVNYLDIAHAYLRRDWTNALNAYWSPLFSWLLALTQWMFRPSPYWESTFLHFLNFALFLFALAAFEFFFARLLSLTDRYRPLGDVNAAVPEWAWWTLGYTAFLVCALRMITLGSDNPDMALAIVFFLAAGLLVGLTQSPGTLHYVLLGLTLGVGYLTKGVMLPLSFVYVVTAAFAGHASKKPDWRALATAVGFLLVSTPFAVALSHVKGRFTFGDTGRVAYFNQVTPMSLAQLASSDFAHRPQQLFDAPAVYTYVTPFTATYPAWYDSSYWLEGVKPRFVFRDQLAAIARSLSGFFRIVSTEKQWIAGWLVLVFVAGDWRKTSELIVRLWFLWLPAMAALALYGLVLVEPRYVAAALAITCVALFAAVLWSSANSLRRVGVSVVLAITATSWIALAKDGVTNLAMCMHSENHFQWQVAQGVLKMGLTPGDQVAVLGHTTSADYWAHLAGLQVTADVPLEALQDYWLASPEKQEEIVSRLRARGIKALVVAQPPPTRTAWRNIGETGYYVQMLTRHNA
jgi:hypothetical protein